MEKLFKKVYATMHSKKPQLKPVCDGCKYQIDRKYNKCNNGFEHPREIKLSQKGMDGGCFVPE